eukprot:CAMPEP_0119550502 /NCGR_PEP_ID=MMETSP1352-20130426/4004_1 /TAXON_ID=265584 /ORGANISM="Stauroneis constricta, Strain CCMP1120" /LENGTH=399 /DNA_ID=CAMNT_0007596377 /DNA_START=130 /DNA_END=1329 /DNA_ORIENTATION=+
MQALRLSRFALMMVASSMLSLQSSLTVSAFTRHHHRRHVSQTPSRPNCNNNRSYRKPQTAEGTALFSTTDEGTGTAAQKLRDRAAQLREEIAKLEGKTIEQVEEEHQQSKLAKQKLEEDRKQKAVADKQNRVTDDGRFVQVPVSHEDMARQAARAVERAFKDGITRQTVRFDLIAEDQAVGDENEWPGGAMQMYREAGKPLANALLKEIRAPTKEVKENERRMPPTVTAQDLWDFDGSALHTAEAWTGASGDVQALVFPNTDVKYINDINTISDAMGPRLFLLVNPFWRNVESWGFNILAPGAKDKAQRAIFDRGFNETYVALSFRARDEKCLALKVYPYDWQLFAYLEDLEYGGPENVIRLGSCKDEPTSSLMAELLNSRPEFKSTKTMRQMKKTLGQ